MATTLYLVRHCESEANLAGTLEGYPDAPLTELGRRQTARLAALFSRWRLTDARLISSPLRRAADTARAIGEAIGATPRLDQRLMAGEGRVRLDFGEAGEEVALCVDEALADGAQPLILVTHRFPLHAFLKRYFGAQMAHALVESAGNGDVFELAFDGAAPSTPRHHRLPGE